MSSPISGEMRCFYHPDREAVGFCKNCGKGLCAETAIDVGNGLACPGPCEKRVERINATWGKTDAMTTVWSSLMGSWLVAIGVAMAGFGLFAWLAWGDFAIGVWLVVLGGVFAFPARRMASARRPGF